MNKFNQMENGRIYDPKLIVVDFKDKFTNIQYSIELFKQCYSILEYASFFIFVQAKLYYC